MEKDYKEMMEYANHLVKYDVINEDQAKYLTLSHYDYIKDLYLKFIFGSNCYIPGIYGKVMAELS